MDRSSLTVEELAAVQAFQEGLKAWRTLRWYRLAWGAFSLALALWLITVVQSAAGTIDSIATSLSDQNPAPEQLHNAVVSLAVSLSIKASGAMLSGSFGLWEVVSTLAIWRGPKPVRVLSVLVARLLPHMKSAA